MTVHELCSRLSPTERATLRGIADKLPHLLDPFDDSPLDGPMVMTPPTFALIGAVIEIDLLREAGKLSAAVGLRALDELAPRLTEIFWKEVENPGHRVVIVHDEGRLTLTFLETAVAHWRRSLASTVPAAK